MDTGSLIDEAISSLNHTKAVNYANVICVALVVLIPSTPNLGTLNPDCFQGLCLLADFRGRAKWNVGKVVSFLTRYSVFLDVALNLVDLIQPNLKLGAAVWMSFTGITIAEIMIMMRVYAIWGAKREVLVFLVVFNLGIITPDIILLQRSLRSFVFMPSPFPTLAPCILIQADVSVYIDFILIMVSVFVVIVMTLWRCFSDWKASKSSLMKALFEDGLQYFVCMFAIYLANLLVVKTANVDFSGLLFEIQRVLHAMLSARMLMHIREATEPVTYSDVSALSFAAAPGKSPRANSGSDIEFGELENGDSYGSSATQTRSVGSRQRGFKVAKAGPLSGVHITRGTIVNEELHQVIGATDISGNTI